MLFRNLLSTKGKGGAGNRLGKAGIAEQVRIKLMTGVASDPGKDRSRSM
jgi:hypothetical protein